MVTRAAWLRQLQEHPDRPRGRQRRQLDALLALADQLDAETGEGTASMLDVAKAAGTSERTTRRAIGWATTSGLLRRTARGHHRWDGTTAVSDWLLSEEPGTTPDPVAPSDATTDHDLPAWMPWVPSYGAIHSRLHARYGPASAHRCAHCGGQAEQWSYDHEDPDELVSPEGLPYGVDLARYKPLCCMCHWRFDGAHQRSATQGTQP